MKLTPRRLVATFAFGLALTGTAVAGTVVAPTLTSSPGGGRSAPGGATAAGGVEPAAPVVVPTAADTGAPDLSGLTPLSGGRFYVGADQTSIAPRSEQWQTSGCSAMASGRTEGTEAQRILQRIAAGTVPPGWPKSDDCVYLGGFGIGPARPATSVDPISGVHVRSVAISNGTSTVVWQMVDLVGFFSKYRSELCNPGCGILDIRAAIADSTGIPAANIAVGATHTHGGADGYGAWGGLPDWYRAQLRDDIIASAYKALASLRVATIEVGSVDARSFNGERRGTYYSATDFGLVWLQAKTVPTTKKGVPTPIVTLANYGAHPTIAGNTPVMHGDWPATASQAMGQALGGVGMVFEGGLGNLSSNRPRNAGGDLTGDGRLDNLDHVIQKGRDFADFLARDIARGGAVMTDSTVKGVTTTISHPITNIAETGLAFSGLLDREFTPLTDGADPGGAYQGGKHSIRKCTSAGPVNVKTDISGFRVGNLTVVTAPGELFSGMTETVKSRARTAAFDGGQTMVFAQTQDSLGYIIQSYEVDAAGGVLTNVEDIVEYEETFMLDRCFGDHVLDAQLQVARELG